MGQEQRRGQDLPRPGSRRGHSRWRAGYGTNTHHAR